MAWPWPLGDIAEKGGSAEPRPDRDRPHEGIPYGI